MRIRAFHLPTIFSRHTTGPLCMRVLRSAFAGAALLFTAPGVFAATLTFSTTAPTAKVDAISNFAGAAFDANNVGGLGVNANGGANNGTANDAPTFVANNQPRQWQTITTGSNANGDDVPSITVRTAGSTSQPLSFFRSIIVRQPGQPN